ncbi:MAG: hypothetical protein EOP60_03785 [Sphingomonadales bacterium]|nr:MAG: hypothetical protein EOP60_03785 [Sphingomonadales bacterium]
MTDAEGARRLHPASLLIDAARSARAYAIPGIVALVAGSRGEFRWIGIALLAGLVLGLVLPALRWRAFTYRIEGGALTIEQGLSNRRRRTIPLDRIQDVSLEQGVAERILGLAKVKIETGGGCADEGLLDGVGLSEARRLRQVLQRGRGASVDAPAETVEEAPLFAMPFGRVLLLGLFNFSLVWLVALMWLIGKADDMLELDWSALADTAEHASMVRLGLWTILALIGLVLALTVIGGVARAVIRYAGFRLTHRDGRFRLQQGLFARRDTVILDRRIQLAQVRGGAIRQWLGWRALEFQTLGGSDGPSGRLEVAPLARDTEIGPILDVAGFPRLQADGWKGIGNRHGLAMALRRGAPIALAASVAGWFEPWAWLGLILLAPVIAVALLATRHHDYALRETDMQVRRGVLRRHAWILPYASVQVVSIRQGPLQRMLGLTTVSADSAGASSGPRLDLVDLPAALVPEVARELVARA